MQNDLCKKVLIEKRSRSLPHWMLSLVEIQPNLMFFLLKDDDFRNSLRLDEFNYLTRNYPKLDAFVTKNNIADPIALAIEEDNELEDFEIR